jgi:RimJ/RimL family protein N-acetyltransferase
MITIEPYLTGDEFHFNPREHAQLGDTRFAWTVKIDEIPVAICGVSEFTPTTGHVWVLNSDKVRGKGVEFSRKLRFMMEKTIETFSFRRYQAFIDAESSENIRWAKFMGFRYEATLREAMPSGSDLLVYARFK